MFSDVASTSYKKVRFPYGEPIELDINVIPVKYNYVSISCPGGVQEANVACPVKRSDGSEAHSETIKECLSTPAFMLPDLVWKGDQPQVFQLECNLTMNDN